MVLLCDNDPNKNHPELFLLKLILNSNYVNILFQKKYRTKYKKIIFIVN